MFKTLWRKKVFIVGIIALLILLPSASVRPAQALSKTILVSVGIEKAADGYTVSGVLNVSTASGTTSTETKVVSADGATVKLAIDNITAGQGREVSLAHCNLIVLGSTLSGENVADILEYFLKRFEISNSALLVWTDSPVEKILETSAANKTDSAGGLVETIASYNQKEVFKRLMTLDRFYKDYLHNRTGYMTAVSLEGEEIPNKKQAAEFKDGLYVDLVSGLSLV